MKIYSSVFLFSSVAVYCVVTSFSNHRTDAPSEVKTDTVQLPQYTLAKEFKGKSVTSSAGLVSLLTGLDNDTYPASGTGRTGNFYVELKVARLQQASLTKTPLNLSIVIDRSGSMAGEKMTVAKKAAKGIIDKLSATDFVSVVIYDEYIDLLQPATAVVYKDSIKARIDKIKPRGSTNLWGGSELGYAQVFASYKKAYINRVLLISDGLANAGTVNPQRIKAGVQMHKDVDGITISTFGVGLDYNETLMTAMAENGAGNYYFIDRPEKMESLFNQELSGLTNLVAQNAELHLTLPKGLLVQSAYPLKFSQTGQEVVIKYLDLFSEESKGVVFGFTLADNCKAPLKLTARLVFTDAADHQTKTVVNENTVSPANTADAYLTYFNKPVVEQVVLFTANDNLEKAALEADKGSYEKADGYISGNKALLQNFVRSSVELRRMDSINSAYHQNLQLARTMSADSVKLMQKSNRLNNYLIRNKKN